jgi:hypothetical protein
MADGSSPPWLVAQIGLVTGPAVCGGGASSGGEARRQSMANVGRIASGEAHELGNLLVGIAFCLKRLRACQRSEERDEILEQALRATDQGFDATRALLRAMRVVLELASYEPGHATTPPV